MAPDPVSRTVNCVRDLGIHLPGKGMVRHDKGKLDCLAWEQGWKNDGSLHGCRLKLRVGFEVGHVFGMAEAING